MNKDWLRVEKEVRAKVAAYVEENPNTLNNSWAKIISIGEVCALLDIIDYIRRSKEAAAEHWSTKAEIHYLACQSENCDFAPCVDRRSTRAKVLPFKKKPPDDTPPSIA